MRNINKIMTLLRHIISNDLKYSTFCAIPQNILTNCTSRLLLTSSLKRAITRFTFKDAAKLI